MQSQEKDLGLKLRKGDSFYFTTNTILTVDDPENEYDEQVATQIFSIFHNKVVDVENDVYHIFCSYTFLKSEHFHNNQDVIFSSSFPKRDFVSYGYSNILDVPFEIFVDKSGRILSIEGYENIQKKFDEVIPEKVKDSVSFLTRNFFDLKNLRNNFHFLFFTPKEKEYKKYAGSNEDLKSTIPLEHSENYVFSVDTESDKRALVSINGKIFTKNNEGEDDASKPDVSGSIDGKIYMNEKNSLEKSGVFVKMFEGEIYAKDIDQNLRKVNVRVTTQFSNAKEPPKFVNQRVLKLIDKAQALNDNGALLLR